MADETRAVIIEGSGGEEPQPRSPGRRRALRALAGAGLAAAGFVAGRTTTPVPTPQATKETKTSPTENLYETLTDTPSAVSQEGWRVRYPEAKGNVSYQNTHKTMEESNVKYGWNKENDLVTISIGGEHTGIIVGTRAVDKKEVPSLTIFTDTRTSNYKSQEFVLAKESPDTKIGERSVDTRVVAFEKPKTGEVRYFQIKIDPIHRLTVAEMVPITK